MGSIPTFHPKFMTADRLDDVVGISVAVVFAVIALLGFVASIGIWLFMCAESVKHF